MKIIAAFDVDEAKLKEIENGNPQSAFGWLEDSGLYLKHYTEFTDKERLPSIENYHRTFGSDNYRIIQTPLKDERYALEAEVYNSDTGEELSIIVKDVKDNVVVQDICLVRAPYEWSKKGGAVKQDGVDVLVWTDETHEDYTRRFFIDINEEYQQHVKESEQEQENTASILKM